MSGEQLIRTASDIVGFASLQTYLLNKGWQKRPSKQEDIHIYFYAGKPVEEIVLTNERDYSDYHELMANAFKKIARVENRATEQVINDFMVPPSDVLRFRVVNNHTEAGIIKLNDGITLLENVRKSVFSSACDEVNPSLYHKKLSNKKAQQFVNSCYLGQTERGSFIASLVCPMVNTTNFDDKPTQLTLCTSNIEMQHPTCCI